MGDGGSRRPAWRRHVPWQRAKIASQTAAAAMYLLGDGAASSPGRVQLERRRPGSASTNEEDEEEGEQADGGGDHDPARVCEFATTLEVAEAVMVVDPSDRGRPWPAKIAVRVESIDDASSDDDDDDDDEPARACSRR